VMGPHHIFILTGFVILTIAAPVFAQQHRAEVLYDFLRTERSYDEPGLPAQQSRQVMTAALGPRYQKIDTNPSINRVVTGSFTAPGLKQTAYVIRGGSGSIAGTINMQNDGRLAIFSGPRMVFNAKFYGNDILRISDLNGDGMNEILLASSWMWMGEVGLAAQLVEVKGSRLRVIKDFETLESAYNCFVEADEASRKNVSSVISYSGGGAGKWPQFRVDFFQGPCPAGDADRVAAEKFKYIGSGKMPEDLPPSGIERKCQLSAANMPGVRGLSLGMNTPDVAAALSLGGALRPDEYGYAGYEVGADRLSTARGRSGDWKGVAYVALFSLDDRLVKFRIRYDNDVKWGGLDEYLGRLSETLSLPGPEYWRRDDRSGASIECEGFQIYARVPTSSSDWPELTLAVTSLDETIQKRKAEALEKKRLQEEEKRKTFKP